MSAQPPLVDTHPPASASGTRKLAARGYRLTGLGLGLTFDIAMLESLK
jgi:hypothetical protein